MSKSPPQKRWLLVGWHRIKFYFWRQQIQLFTSTWGGFTLGFLEGVVFACLVLPGVNPGRRDKPSPGTCFTSRTCNASVNVLNWKSWGFFLVEGEGLWTGACSLIGVGGWEKVGLDWTWPFSGVLLIFVCIAFLPSKKKKKSGLFLWARDLATSDYSYELYVD